MNNSNDITEVYLQTEHYPEIMALWQRAGLHVRPTGRDSAAAFAQQQALGVQTPFGLRAEGQLVAVALATHDGRKGWINRLAVDPAWRGCGLGLRLIRLCEAHFQSVGIDVWAALIEDWNAASLALFRKAGYDLADAITYASRRSRGDV